VPIGRPDELRSAVVVEGEPRDCEVVCGIPSGHIAEVDDARQARAVRDEVCGVQIAVDPDRRPMKGGDTQTIAPDGCRGIRFWARQRAR
jgi:hypothetical protein